MAAAELFSSLARAWYINKERKNARVSKRTIGAIMKDDQVRDPRRLCVGHEDA